MLEQPTITPNHIPPILSICEAHLKASTFKRQFNRQGVDNRQHCPCCDQFYYEDQKDMLEAKYATFEFDFEDTETELHCPAISYFFVLGKHEIYIYLMLSALALVELIINVSGNEGNESNAVGISKIAITSFLYVGEPEEWILICDTIIHQFMIIVLFFLQLKLSAKLAGLILKMEKNSRHVEARDFALCLRNLPISQVKQVTSDITRNREDDIHLQKKKDQILRNIEQNEKDIKKLKEAKKRFSEELIDLKEDVTSYEASKNNLKLQRSQSSTHAFLKRASTKTILNTIDISELNTMKNKLEENIKTFQKKNKDLEKKNSKLAKFEPKLLMQKNKIKEEITKLKEEIQSLKQSIQNPFSEGSSSSIQNESQHEIEPFNESLNSDSSPEKSSGLKETNNQEIDLIEEDKESMIEMEDDKIQEGQPEKDKEEIVFSERSETRRTLINAEEEAKIRNKIREEELNNKTTELRQLEKKCRKLYEKYSFIEKYLKTQNEEIIALHKIIKNYEEQYQQVKAFIEYKPSDNLATETTQSSSSPKALKSSSYENSFKKLLRDKLNKKSLKKIWKAKILELKKYRIVLLSAKLSKIQKKISKKEIEKQEYSIELLKIDLGEKNILDMDEKEKKGYYIQKENYEGMKYNLIAKQYEFNLSNFFEEIFGFGTVKQIIMLRNIDDAMKSMKIYLENSSYVAKTTNLRRNVLKNKDESCTICSKKCQSCDCFMKCKRTILQGNPEDVYPIICLCFNRRCKRSSL